MAARRASFLNAGMRKFFATIVGVPDRSVISDYVSSLLLEEVTNRCPLCGRFEGTLDRFTNHHINHDPLVSEYWNLIRICRPCHTKIEKHKHDGRRDRKLWQVKRLLFRNLVGAAAYDVLMMAHQYEITSTLPSLARTLLKMKLVSLEQANSMKVGVGNHPTISAFRITQRGKELIKKLNLT